MPENNLRQADVPDGATIIPQARGTAPGLICPVGDGGDDSPKVIYAVPGVPYELYEMIERAVLPDLKRRAGVTATIVSRTLRTWGDSESGLAERLAGRVEELDSIGTPTLAFLASGMEGIKVRITAKAETEAAARSIVEPEEATLRQLLGDLVFGVDDETMEYAVLRLLRDRGATLALAESLTGGLIGARITNVAGASRSFVGGVVSYASEVKHDLLDVPAGPVVSASAVEAMATGARRVVGADIGLAVTGVAGPDEQDGERPGTVFVGLAMADDDVVSRRLTLPGDRDRVRQFTVITALDLLRHRLLADARGEAPTAPKVFGA
jgi:nicotinamide-nucleotide amidase